MVWAVATGGTVVKGRLGGAVGSRVTSGWATIHPEPRRLLGKQANACSAVWR